ncbi:MAG: TonB family protein, partial [Bdellovibrionota bacterium]
TPNEIDRGDQTLPARVNRSAQEYLRGFKESDRTLLNTKEYVFFSYFQRIRQRLDTAWQPLLRNHITKLYKRGRQLASEVDHKTQLLVVLNKKGEIEKVQMIEESGVSDLDQAAVEAFNQAGPFPNPPRGLVDGGGHVEIGCYFVLKT